jgi:2-dehydropantoate 2-reductase
VLVLVKAHQTPWAAEQARILSDTPDSHPRPIVFTLQNGIGNRETLAETLGAQQIGQAVTSLGATLLGPGRIRHAGMGATIVSEQPNRAAAQALVELFTQSGLPATLSNDLDTLVWSKLIVNVGINALTALLRVPNGTLAEQPAATALVALIVAEAVAVAKARGIHLPYADPLEHVLEIAQATGSNRSSMLQDVIRNSQTEIVTINGAIVREGTRLGIATPANHMITQLVQALDATAPQRIG